MLSKRCDKLRQQLIKLLECVFSFYEVLSWSELRQHHGSGRLEVSAFPRLSHLFNTFLCLAQYILR
jgi:hypothetical protein